MLFLDGFSLFYNFSRLNYSRYMCYKLVHLQVDEAARPAVLLSLLNVSPSQSNTPLILLVEVTQVARQK